MFGLKRFSQIFFSLKLFPRKRFCNRKHFSTKTFSQFFPLNCFRGNYFAKIKNIAKIFLTKKIIDRTFFHLNFPEKYFSNNKQFTNRKFFDQKFSQKLFFHLNFPRKWFCNNKKLSTKKIFDLKFFHPNCFRGNDFATIEKIRPKNFSTIKLRPKKVSQKLFSSTLFPRNWFCNNKISKQKKFLKKLVSSKLSEEIFQQ